MQSKQLQNAALGQILVCAGVLVFGGCSHRTARIAAPPDVASIDNSYADLQPGSKVRIVVPILKSGALHPDLRADSVEGATISITAADLLGYTTSFYSANGRAGKVRLEFMSARETKDGKSLPIAKTLAALPFELPPKAGYIRLVYFVRSSQADHNMAILGGRNRSRLNAYTVSLKQDPRICNTRGDVFCSWVPAGVAVRRED